MYLCIMLRVTLVVQDEQANEGLNCFCTAQQSLSFSDFFMAQLLDGTISLQIKTVRITFYKKELHM